MTENPGPAHIEGMLETLRKPKRITDIKETFDTRYTSLDKLVEWANGLGAEFKDVSMEADVEYDYGDKYAASKATYLRTESDEEFGKRLDKYNKSLKLRVAFRRKHSVAIKAFKVAKLAKAREAALSELKAAEADIQAKLKELGE